MYVEHVQHHCQHLSIICLAALCSELSGQLGFGPSSSDVAIAALFDEINVLASVHQQ